MVRRAVVVALLTAALPGCSWFGDDKGLFVDRSDDYVDAALTVPLVVPEDLQKDRLQDPFPIPVTPKVAKAEYFPGRPPLPDAIYSGTNREEVRIQRLSKRRWLVVPEPPTTVWPKIKQFLAENGVAITSEISGEGRLNSEWLDIGDEERRDLVGLIIQEARQEAAVVRGRDRILVQVEQGLRELTSEIHVRHENDALKVPIQDGTLDIEPHTSALGLAEQEVLGELGAFIAAKVAEQTVSLVGGEIAGQPKAELGRATSGDPVLRLHLDEERAWATIGQALANARVDVTAIDRERGLYYVLIPETLFTGEEEPGFISGLFSRDSEVHELIIGIQKDNLGLHVVSVSQAESQPVERDLSQQVLVLLREFAS
ncbi:MAG: outer membrane protein assembly factor BamC [Pseudomonadales bacterium]|jgi:outer membrane protein assembly factor BamC|nr:outer membrane protein assembly factor BamC [Pseudomonadales bacterium]MDP6471026.1 outer membrane protein assembly factor BamC [Pseudomonadales bacterium]MDP6825788.1 outer membrane protein assembly factor BamC [Pseudomonadales bacterium]MDP6970218.1 outer membrane protein assembly factor BamC [Pseudomonadales bacterium]|tara:strand:- start:56 stop:1168 length:1113 start_codon:yes stop_codon:yes gene_type:complete